MKIAFLLFFLVFPAFSSELNRRLIDVKHKSKVSFRHDWNINVPITVKDIKCFNKNKETIIMYKDDGGLNANTKVLAVGDNDKVHHQNNEEQAQAQQMVPRQRANSLRGKEEIAQNQPSDLVDEYDELRQKSKLLKEERQKAEKLQKIEESLRKKIQQLEESVTDRTRQLQDAKTGNQNILNEFEQTNLELDCVRSDLRTKEEQMRDITAEKEGNARTMLLLKEQIKVDQLEKERRKRKRVVKWKNKIFDQVDDYFKEENKRIAMKAAKRKSIATVMILAVIATSVFYVFYLSWIPLISLLHSKFVQPPKSPISKFFATFRAYIGVVVAITAAVLFLNTKFPPALTRATNEDLKNSGDNTSWYLRYLSDIEFKNLEKDNIEPFLSTDDKTGHYIGYNESNATREKLRLVGLDEASTFQIKYNRDQSFRMFSKQNHTIEKNARERILSWYQNWIKGTGTGYYMYKCNESTGSWDGADKYTRFTYNDADYSFFAKPFDNQACQLGVYICEGYTAIYRNVNDGEENTRFCFQKVKE